MFSSVDKLGKIFGRNISSTNLGVCLHTYNFCCGFAFDFLLLGDVNERLSDERKLSRFFAGAVNFRLSLV